MFEVLEVIGTIIVALLGIVISIVGFILFIGIFSSYHSYVREREWFLEEFISATRYIRSLEDKLEKMYEELEKTEKELTALIDNK